MVTPLGLDAVTRASGNPVTRAYYLGQILPSPRAFSYAVTRRHSTRGSVSNWWKGGGDGSVHSSVVAPMPQGLAGASLFRAKA